MSERVLQTLTSNLRELATVGDYEYRVIVKPRQTYVLPTKPGPTVLVNGFKEFVNACHYE
jgi:hypothetical protein